METAVRTALIVGAGPGLSSSIARRLAQDGVKIGLTARDTSKLADLERDVSGSSFTCDVANAEQVERLFKDFETRFGPPDAVIVNPSARARGPIAELDPKDVERALMVTAFGGFLVGQQAAKTMLPRAFGAILFTGASASLKGFAGSSPFAMGKFALRGLAQSMARELGPNGIHVAHVIVDGGILSAGNPNPDDQPESRLNPDAIAETFAHLIGQHRCAWTHEVDLRPWTERF